MGIVKKRNLVMLAVLVGVTAFAILPVMYAVASYFTLYQQWLNTMLLRIIRSWSTVAIVNRCVWTASGGIVKMSHTSVQAFKEYLLKNETDLYHKFLGEFTVEVGGNAHITRIESNLTSQGIPDADVAYHGREFWVEFKYGDNKLEPLQISWIRRHALYGGKTFVIRYRNQKYELSLNLDAKMETITDIYQAVRLIVAWMRTK